MGNLVPGIATGTVVQGPSRFGDAFDLDGLDGDHLQRNYLTGFKFTGANDEELPPEWWDEKLGNAIAKFETITQIDVLERAVTAERHDYATTDYLNYAYLQLFRVPAQSVAQVAAVYPTGQTIQVFPSEWVRLQKEHSQIHLVPTAGSLAQVTLGGGNGYLPFIFAGLSYLPQLWHVDYVSGFPSDAVPRAIVDAICKLAVIAVLTEMSDTVGPIGVASSSLSVDGLAQSIARQLPAFKARIDRYAVELGLPAPGMAVDPKYGTGELGQLRRSYYGLAVVSL